jgi:hypothetical protein
MLSKDQEQHAAEGSIAIQSAGDVTVTTTGLSYSEVRDVALDTFNANFYKFADTAGKLATARAEEITEKFLSKLQKEAPAGLGKSQDPDFQYALLTVQKEYAKSGDENLGDLLVDLLVDRSKQEKREILQIVLNEALNTAPKLTDSQLAVLAIVFLFRYTQNNGIGSHQNFGEYLDKFATPFVSKIVKNQACYQHLEFSGCGSISVGTFPLPKQFGTTYQGLFVKGFDQQEIIASNISIGLDQRFFIQCLNDSSKIQVKALNKDQLEASFEAHALAKGDRDKIAALFDVGKMGDAEIIDKCVSIRPYMVDLFENWSGSPMKNLTLTSVGIAIGHANIKRFAGEFANLSIWIN